MERPFKNIRPIGPFSQGALEPNDEELAPNEIRIILGRLADSVEDNITALESVKSGEVHEDVGDMAINMTRFNRRNIDSAASKLAAKHENLTGTLPNSWNEYQEQIKRRDELLKEVT